MMTSRVVTIDGPAGAGKSTVARRLSERLGWRLLDTGAMYRAVALAAIRTGTDLQSESALTDLVADLEVVITSHRVTLDGEDVSQAIRTIEVTKATRWTADSPGVRSRLVEWQRQYARAEGQVITEGRDQGTIVFPDAYRKYYVTASAEERARRRLAEFTARGEPISFDSVLESILTRDQQDAERAIAPMKPAEDAEIVDTTGRDIEEIVQALERGILDISAQIV